MNADKSASPSKRFKAAPMLSSFEHIEETFDSGRDLVCFSHLRWDFVYQRPQHLMSRFACEGRVFFVEEPVFGAQSVPGLSMHVDPSGVCIVVPHFPESTTPEFAISFQRRLIDEMFSNCRIRDSILWYYTPMARSFTSHLRCHAIIYDCMDELSLFKGAPKELRMHEAELMKAADVVFTGGVSLFEAKKSLHHNIHAAPSSIDIDHFSSARSISSEPDDQVSIPRPRLGFAGVIDERMDIDLLASVSQAHPEWHFVFIGPIVKIDPETLPRHENIHYLHQKPYSSLPSYLAGWDVALMPFARNDATRYISPTKTPEYIAAGKPVVSTSIRDVVEGYGTKGLVRIADTPEEFAVAIQQSLADNKDPKRRRDWQQRADVVLANMSWDRTWAFMMKLVEQAIATREDNRRANAS